MVALGHFGSLRTDCALSLHSHQERKNSKIELKKNI